MWLCHISLILKIRSKTQKYKRATFNRWKRVLGYDFLQGPLYHREVLGLDFLQGPLYHREKGEEGFKYMNLSSVSNPWNNIRLDFCQLLLKTKAKTSAILFLNVYV